MASTTVNAYQYKHFNSNWSGWSTTLSGGYSGSTKYATVIRYKVPDSEYFNPPYTIKVKIPWIRQSSSAKSGTFTIYLFTSDPTGDKGTTNTNTPSSIKSSTSPAKRDTVTASWSASDQELHTTTVTLSYSPTSATTATYFYIWIANSVDFLEIGYSGEVTASSYAMTITYNDGTVRVYNGSSWVKATPYVYNGSSWVRATACVYDGSKWIFPSG